METSNLPANKTAGAIAKPIVPPKKGLEEGIDREEFMIPRAKLLQALSPEVADDKGDVRKYKPGQIINSITKETLPVEFVPIYKFTEWIRFNPRDKGKPNFDPAFDPGALIYRTRNTEDQRLKTDAVFGPNGEAPATTRFMNFLAMFVGYPNPIIVSFANTSFKAGKQLLNAIQYAEGGEIYSRKYRLTSKEQKNEKGQFYVLETSLVGPLDEKEFARAESWYNDLQPMFKKIETHQEGAAEEQPAEAASRPY